jgi:two-component system LytT family response regulator
MKKIRTIIVDDESLAREGIRLRLKKFTDIKIIAECKNGREALKVVQEMEPDLIFLDIQIPGLDGFDVVAQLQGDNMPLVVFVTAFDKYAIDAFEVHAIDYVLKPVEDSRLQTAIDRVRIHRQQSNADNHKKRLIDLITNITGQSAIQI